MPDFVKSVRDIKKYTTGFICRVGKHQKLCIIYVQLTKIDLHKNHLIESQIDGLIIPLLSSRYLYQELKINLSNILPQTGNNGTGR